MTPPIRRHRRRPAWMWWRTPVWGAARSQRDDAEATRLLGLIPQPRHAAGATTPPVHRASILVETGLLPIVPPPGGEADD